jgi:peroxiredoxin (alkyl hydroperoxide reductase subunit C)
MVEVDKQFPDFSLETFFVENGEVGRVSNQDFLNHWFIFFWYPADRTFICPTELADLGNYHEELERRNVRVLAASTDSIYTHKGWFQTEPLISKMKFPMASDPDGKCAKTLSIYDEKSKHAQRAVFVIDPRGVLRAVAMVSDSIGRSAKEIVRELKALSFVYNHPDQACPASWEEGMKAILLPKMKPDIQ